MARCRCKVRFGSFRWKRSGYREVMNGRECQSILFSKANRMASELSTESGAAYHVRRKEGNLADGCIVAASKEAMDGELRNNRLKRKADGA